MGKHICNDCIYHDMDEARTDEGDFLYCFCAKGNTEIHEECGCDECIYTGKGQPIECKDFVPFPN
jgi:hypothetical protein